MMTTPTGGAVAPDPIVLLPAVEALARRAGDAVMALYRDGCAVRAKADDSPVTAADEASEAVILPGLAVLTPSIPVISEEQAAAGCAPAAAAWFWLVDPLDGTREFIDRNGEFTVNIALVRDGVPVLGVVFAPALGAGGHSYAGVVGQGAWLEDDGGRRVIGCRAVPPDGLTVVASRRHGDTAALDRFLGTHKVAGFAGAGSSLKFCRVAAGAADLYPRFGRTMEWDTAAGHAVLAAAGGRVAALDGAPLAYGKPGLDNPHFIAASCEALRALSAVDPNSGPGRDR